MVRAMRGVWGVLAGGVIAATSAGQVSEVVVNPDGQQIGGLRAADVDGDGVIDVVALLYEPALAPVVFSVTRGVGPDAFAPPVIQTATGQTPVGPLAPLPWELGDVDGDGTHELVTFSDDERLDVHDLVGDQFVVTHTTTTPDPSAGLTLADVDGDGRDDVVTGNRATGRVRIHPGLASGGLGDPIELQALPFLDDIAVADLDADGDLDVVALSQDGFSGATANVAVLRQEPGDAFALEVVPVLGLPLDSVPEIGAGDIDGDGRVDLFVTNVAGGVVLLGQPDDTFVASPFVPFVRVGDLVDVDDDGSVEVFAGGLWDWRDGTLVEVDRHGRQAASADVDGDGFTDALVVSQFYAVELRHGHGAVSWRELAPTAPRSFGRTALGDVDGDGRVDLVSVEDVPGASTSTASLARGGIAGAFEAPEVLAVEVGLEAVAVADVDGDGAADLTTVTTGALETFTLRTSFGDGTGGFAAPVVTELPALDAGSIVGIGDVTGDGLPEVLVRAFPPDEMHVVSPQDDGTWLDLSTYSVPGREVLETRLADLDGDGISDVVTRLISTPGPVDTYWVAALRGAADGVLTLLSPSVPSSLTGTLAVGDVTGDATPDLVVSERVAGDGELAIYPGLGDGSWGAPIVLPSPDEEGWLAAGDFDGDGDGDVAAVTADLSVGRVTVHWNQGDGTYLTSSPILLHGAGPPPQQFPQPRPFEPLAAIDLDGDGVVELARTRDTLAALRFGGVWTTAGASLPSPGGGHDLWAEGALGDGSTLTLHVPNGPASALATFVVGLAAIDAPFKGGVLVPSPDVLVTLPTDADGAVSIVAPWPAGVPSGLELYVQTWFAAGPASTIALRGVVP